MRLPRKKLVGPGLAVVSAVAYALAFPGFEQWYLAWICLVPVLWALDEAASGREAFLVALIFGTVAQGILIWWLIGALRDFLDISTPAAFILFVPAVVAQGSLLVVWGWLVHASTRRGLSIAWAAPAVMVVAEWLWPSLFPWYLAGTQYRHPALLQSLELVGPLGLTFLITLTSAALYQVALKKGSRWCSVGLASLFLANLLFGALARDRVADEVNGARRIVVGVVQPNLGIDSTLDQRLERVRELASIAERRGAELIVAPEALFEVSDADAGEAVGALRTPMIFGAVRSEGRALHNSAVLVDSERQVRGVYDKTDLFPVSELVPLTALEDLPNVTRLTAGAQHQPPLEFDDGTRVGTLICWEGIKSRLVRRTMTHDPHVLVNLSNDAWFGHGQEPSIHLALTALRAVEYRRFLVRAANSGISAVVAPTGDIVAEAPVLVRSVLGYDVAVLEGKTLYAHMGDAVGWLCLVGLSAWAARRLWHTRAKSSS